MQESAACYFFWTMYFVSSIFKLLFMFYYYANKPFSKYLNLLINISWSKLFFYTFLTNSFKKSWGQNQPFQNVVGTRPQCKWHLWDLKTTTDLRISCPANLLLLSLLKYFHYPSGQWTEGYTGTIPLTGTLWQLVFTENNIIRGFLLFWNRLIEIGNINGAPTNTSVFHSQLKYPLSFTSSKRSLSLASNTH